MGILQDMHPAHNPVTARLRDESYSGCALEGTAPECTAAFSANSSLCAPEHCPIGINRCSGTASDPSASDDGNGFVFPHYYI